MKTSNKACTIVSESRTATNSPQTKYKTCITHSYINVQELVKVQYKQNRNAFVKIFP